MKTEHTDVRWRMQFMYTLAMISGPPQRFVENPHPSPSILHITARCSIPRLPSTSVPSSKRLAGPGAASSLSFTSPETASKSPRAAS